MINPIPGFSQTAILAKAWNITYFIPVLKHGAMNLFIRQQKRLAGLHQ
jgi:hypothetical protein